nr:hypothetical protein [Pseudopedobacter sp.]
MNTQNKLVISKPKQEKLSKSQVEFNTLNNRIRKTKEFIELDLEYFESILNTYHKMLYPKKQIFAKALFNLCKSLDLTANKLQLISQFKNLGSTIHDVFDIAFGITEPNEEEENLYNRYAEKTYKDELLIQVTMAKNMFAEMMKESTGVDIDLSEINMESAEDRAKLKEELDSKIKEAKVNRPQSASELKKELKLKQEEEIKLKSIKSIYISLVKLLHPDTEIDAIKKLEKTAIMQRVTKAYQDKDMNTLLQLELDWLSSESKNLGTLPDKQLKMYNKALAQQLRELETSRNTARFNPRFQMISAYIELPLKQAESSIFTETQASIIDEKIIKDLTIGIEMVKNKKEFSKALINVNEFVSDFKHDAMFGDDYDDDDELDDFFNNVFYESPKTKVKKKKK